MNPVFNGVKSQLDNLGEYVVKSHNDSKKTGQMLFFTDYPESLQTKLSSILNLLKDIKSQNTSGAVAQSCDKMSDKLYRLEKLSSERIRSSEFILKGIKELNGIMKVKEDMPSPDIIGDQKGHRLMVNHVPFHSTSILAQTPRERVDIKREKQVNASSPDPVDPVVQNLVDGGMKITQVSFHSTSLFAHKRPKN